ncbi:hypothetical protein ACSXCH_10180 [Clostridium perfringens]|nr:hypothetical protein [Clostridium perfringens]
MNNSIINCKCEEPDSSIETWKYFRNIYTEDHWELIKEFDLKNICTYEQRNNKPDKNMLRYRAYLKVDSIYTKKLGKQFSLAGDCDFNFNNKKRSKFEKILKKEISIKELKKEFEKLNQCCLMHYNKLNFSIMPVTGGMNNFKGIVKVEGDSYDRLDTFIYYLNEFYINGDKRVLNKSRYNEKSLNQYLNTFDNIYDYCNKVYFINNREFVNKLISNGCKTIKNSEELMLYMNLAQEYWEIKKSNINSKFI